MFEAIYNLLAIFFVCVKILDYIG